MSQVRPGVLIAAIVFAVFAAYAFLAPATYRTSAVLVVDSGGPDAHTNLPEPLEAARRLSEAILDRTMLERLSIERARSTAGSSVSQARAEAASLIRHSLEIDTSDARTFSISYQDTSKQRVQRVCNQLAQHAVARAPLVLADRSAERAQELNREQRIQALAVFLSLHPEAAAEGPATGERSPDRDLALSAFHAERANLERRLRELENGVGSDNPYVDAVEADPKLLHRRLAEIDNALSARRTALIDQSHSPAKVLSPELQSEWKGLLDALAKSSEQPALVSPPLVARVATAAPVPSWPIEPNRPLLLLLGVVFGSGLGMAFTLVAQAAQQRRKKSSRPPAVVTKALAVHVPPAPAVPSGLGPDVPSFQPTLQLPRASEGPAIVPVPLRQISSTPAARTADGGGSSAFAPAPQPVAPPHAVEAGYPSNNAQPNAAPTRFASTLVLPPAQNPTPERTPDPDLAAAAQVWDEQIRAHAVPGFAVVRPGSETTPTDSEPPGATDVLTPAIPVQRTAFRSPTQMKVTQPLGSFLPDLLLNPSNTPGFEPFVSPRAPAASRTPLPPRSPSPAPPQSRYSYVSVATPSENTLTIVRPAPTNWTPDATLQPPLRRRICEQLYPLAVEGCLVVLVVGVPEQLELKSRVAAELALALAASGHPRILLMDGDVQAPRVHGLLNVDMPMTAGFSQQLRDRANGGQGRRWTVVSCGTSLHVLAEGLMRTPGLLLSRQFSEGLSELRNYYDFIIIDGPSASLTVEAQALDSVIDGVVFCGREGSPSLSRLQALFREKRIKTLVTSP